MYPTFQQDSTNISKPSISIITGKKIPETATQTAQLRPNASISSTSNPVSNCTYSAAHGTINVTNNYYGDIKTSQKSLRNESVGPVESEHLVPGSDPNPKTIAQGPSHSLHPATRHRMLYPKKTL
jgi:hypothetical protein